MNNIRFMEIAPGQKHELRMDAQSHFGTFEVKDDATLWQKVNKLAHSTFDRSKFTVVGSPNITDDGIASGFSSSNYINIGNTVSYTNFIGHSFKITCGFTHKSTTANTNQTLFQMYHSNSPQSVRTYNNKVICSLTTSAYSERTLTPTLIEGNFYTVTLEHNQGTSKYILSLFDSNNILLDSVDTFTTGDLEFIEAFETKFYIGYAISGQWQFLGSIDLKQFSITIDGVEVFSGNKTGIDTIKPDDYTVVGTPTISADGILSGVSASDYLMKTNAVDLSNAKEAVIQAIIKVPTRTYESYVAERVIELYRYLGLRVAYSAPANSWRAYAEVPASAASQPVSLSLGETYIVQAVYNLVTGEYYCRVKPLNSSANWTESYHETQSSLTSLTILDAYIGYSKHNNVTDDIIDIDLNTIEVYADGDLVYQPCLKIPYTESSGKYGSKIVSAIYRDRVKDAYEQGYQQRYYTLDEENGNFTLPMGDIYGMIESLRQLINQMAS